MNIYIHRKSNAKVNQDIMLHMNLLEHRLKHSRLMLNIYKFIYSEIIQL
jgi:hypothetical protein